MLFWGSVVVDKVVKSLISVEKLKKNANVEAK
jgi:hypothetical protein